VNSDVTESFPRNPTFTTPIFGQLFSKYAEFIFQKSIYESLKKKTIKNKNIIHGGSGFYILKKDAKRSQSFA